jgi:hypothetical protein
MAKMSEDRHSSTHYRFKECERPYLINKDSLGDVLGMQMMRCFLEIEMAVCYIKEKVKCKLEYYDIIGLWAREKIASEEWRPPNDVDVFIGEQVGKLKQLEEKLQQLFKIESSGAGMLFCFYLMRMVLMVSRLFCTF